MISPDLLSSAARTHLTSQLGFATSMTESMIETMEKLMGLNLQAARASLDMTLGSAQQMMGTKDPRDFLSVSSSQVQPHADIMMTYVRHLSSIASDTHKQLARITQDKVNESSREIVSMLDGLGSSAPEGSQNSISLLRAAIDHAATGYSQMTQTTQDAIDQLESGISAASTQLTTMTTKSNGRAKKSV
jgi:phasin family protein